MSKKTSAQVAREALNSVCGDGGQCPDAKTIVRACVPIIQASMITTYDENSIWENEQAALIAKRAFCAGFMEGENKVYGD